MRTRQRSEVFHLRAGRLSPDLMSAPPNAASGPFEGGTSGPDENQRRRVTSFLTFFLLLVKPVARHSPASKWPDGPPSPRFHALNPYVIRKLSIVLTRIDVRFRRYRRLSCTPPTSGAEHGLRASGYAFRNRGSCCPVQGPQRREGPLARPPPSYCSGSPPLIPRRRAAQSSFDMRR